MKVVQLVKQLNNTELGKAGTNDTYVRIPNELDISCIFEKVDKKIEFTDKNTMEKVVVRNTFGSEKRIVGLGQYYRAYDLSAGDEILFERITVSGKDQYWINVKKNPNSFVVQKSRYGLEILTPDRTNLVDEWRGQLGIDIELKFLESKKKRQDSPITTDYYNIVINGESIRNSIPIKAMALLEAHGKEIKIRTSYEWKKYVFLTEDE